MSPARTPESNALTGTPAQTEKALLAAGMAYKLRSSSALDADRFAQLEWLFDDAELRAIETPPGWLWAPASARNPRGEFFELATDGWARSTAADPTSPISTQSWWLDLSFPARAAALARAHPAASVRAVASAVLLGLADSATGSSEAEDRGPSDEWEIQAPLRTALAAAAADLRPDLRAAGAALLAMFQIDEATRLSSGGPAGDTAPAPRRAGESGRPRAQVSTCIHGTGASVGDWWRSGQDGNLFDYLRRGVRPDLFVGKDDFSWTGELNPEARDLAGRRLAEWASAQSGGHCDTLFAHSHGGNVALAAATKGLKARLLVLMHVPLTRLAPDHWALVTQNIEHALVLRARWDLVVWAAMIREPTIGGALPPADLAASGWFETFSPSPTHLRPSFSHTYYLNRVNWERRSLPTYLKRLRERQGWSA